MKMMRILSVMLFLILLSGGSQAAELTATKYTLDNGLTVLITEVPTSPVIAVYGLIKTGSAREGKFLGCGVSHFVEHMLFKGTDKRGVGEIPAQVQAAGGSINASTGTDYTMFTINVPKDQFDLGLDILSDMLMHPKFDPVELEKERLVILKEMELYEDEPDHRLNKLVSQNVYLKHPYRHPIIGYPDLFRNVSRDDLVEYFKSRYSPNNTIISIAGNVKKDEIFPKIKKIFESFSRKPDLSMAVPQEPTQISKRFYEEAYPTDVTRVSMSFSGTSMNDDDMVPLDVLAKILGQGASSRLYLDVYKKRQLVYSIGANDSTPVDRGSFEIEASLDYKNIPALADAVWQNIRQIQLQGVTAKELEKVKNSVLSEYVFDHQTASSLAYSQAIGEAFLADPNYDAYYIQSIKRVTLDDIKRVARKYLQEDKLTVVILKPQEIQAESKKEKSMVNAKNGEIVKFELKNGVRVLLRQDNAFPVVSVRLVLNGGLRQETADNNGIFSLLASTWTRGTKKMKPDQMAELLESSGIGLGGFSGNNSFGLSMSCLKENFDQGMILFMDALRNPLFSDEEISNTKKNMLEGIRRRKDDIMTESGFTLKQKLYGSHPYGMDQSGTETSIPRLDRKALLALYKQYVYPSNMVFSVFGDIDVDTVRKKIETLFSAIPDRPGTIWPSVPVKEIAAPVDFVLNMDKKQALVSFGFIGVDFKNNDQYSLKVLMTILGSSFEGRLFQKVREKLGQAYHVGGYSSPGVDRGQLVIYSLTSPEKAAGVNKIMTDEILDIQKGNISDKEINDAKAYLKGTFQAGLETNDALNFIATLDELYGLGYDNYTKFSAEIDAVTKDKVKEAANKYLDLNKRVIITTIPVAQR
ncbi:MAG: insulinase family protein [Candidatus Omnitrophica bacterium]|nr:insulinase family protein [Candidatus Omnitrophota bacterium]